MCMILMGWMLGNYLRKLKVSIYTYNDIKYNIKIKILCDGVFICVSIML